MTSFDFNPVSGYGEYGPTGLPSSINLGGAGAQFQFNPDAFKMITEMPGMQSAIQEFTMHFVDVANGMADPGLLAASETSYHAEFHDDPDRGPVGVITGGELDDAVNSTLFKLAAGDFSGPMTPADAEEIEALARMQNGEMPWETTEDEEEEVAQRDRPVSRKKTKDPAFRNFPDRFGVEMITDEDLR